MIELSEKLIADDYEAVADLLREVLYTHKDITTEDVKKAFTHSAYVVYAYKDDRLVGLARAISDEIEWTYLAELAVREEFREKGIGSSLVKSVVEHFKGHEIFSVSFADAIPFYENSGFKRSKNGFTYAGWEEEYLNQTYPKDEFYLHLGYKYETEFYPFAGNFPVGRKSELKKEKIKVRYTTDSKDVNMDDLNVLLTKSFGGHDRDVNVTKKAFTTSDYYAFAYDGKKLIGCARAISDGVLQGLILNVAVDPEYQGIHLGQSVVDLLCKQMKGQTIYLNTHPGGVGFYNRPPYRRNKTAILYPRHPEMPEDIAKGFVLPKGFRFANE